MQRSTSSFQANCESRDVGPAEIARLVEALGVPFRSIIVGRVEIKFTTASKRESIFGTDFKHYAKLWSTIGPDIRRVTVYFSRNDMRKSAPIEHVYFSLSREFWTKSGEPVSRLQLNGSGCYESSFNEFVEIVVRTIGTKLIPPEGSTWERERIAARWKDSLVDSELVNQISGSMAKKQFDTALRTAINIVESRLKAKCLKVGASSAASLAGADLAVVAFHKDRGCLTPPWPVATEAYHGAQLLFQGFFMYLRNAYMHNSVVMGSDEEAVYDLLVTCEFLLKIIDKSKPR